MQRRQHSGQTISEEAGYVAKSICINYFFFLLLRAEAKAYLPCGPRGIRVHRNRKVRPQASAMASGEEAGSNKLPSVTHFSSSAVSPKRSQTAPPTHCQAGAKYHVAVTFSFIWNSCKMTIDIQLQSWWGGESFTQERCQETSKCSQRLNQGPVRSGCCSVIEREEAQVRGGVAEDKLTLSRVLV